MIFVSRIAWNVVLTSMRRDHVASTSIRHHFGIICPLGDIDDITVSLSLSGISLLQRHIKCENGALLKKKMKMSSVG